MNYNMQWMTKMIHEIFVMLKLAKVEIKKEHQVLMVNNITSFKKTGHGKNTELQEEWQASCKDGKVNKGIFDVYNFYDLFPNQTWIFQFIWFSHVIDVYFTSVYSNPSVFDIGLVAKSSN